MELTSAYSETLDSLLTTWTAQLAHSMLRYTNTRLRELEDF